MLVNLVDVFTNDGCVQEMDVPYEAERFSCVYGNFSIQEKNPVTLRLSHLGQSKALAEGNIKLTLVLACDRCLKDVEYPFDVTFRLKLVSPDYAGADRDDYEFSVLEGNHLNVDELIRAEILFNWPEKVLCREDCKGICKVCGQNPNDGACGCDDFVPDPRMAVIKDLMNANKEV